MAATTDAIGKPSPAKQPARAGLQRTAPTRPQQAASAGKPAAPALKPASPSAATAPTPLVNIEALQKELFTTTNNPWYIRGEYFLSNKFVSLLRDGKVMIGGNEITLQAMDPKTRQFLLEKEKEITSYLSQHFSESLKSVIQAVKREYQVYKLPEADLQMSLDLLTGFDAYCRLIDPKNPKALYQVSASDMGITYEDVRVLGARLYPGREANPFSGNNPFTDPNSQDYKDFEALKLLEKNLNTPAWQSNKQEDIKGQLLKMILKCREFCPSYLTFQILMKGSAEYAKLEETLLADNTILSVSEFTKLARLRKDTAERLDGEKAKITEQIMHPAYKTFLAHGLLKDVMTTSCSLKQLLMLYSDNRKMGVEGITVLVENEAEIEKAKQLLVRLGVGDLILKGVEIKFEINPIYVRKIKEQAVSGDDLYLSVRIKTNADDAEDVNIRQVLGQYLEKLYQQLNPGKELNPSEARGLLVSDFAREAIAYLDDKDAVYKRIKADGKTETVKVFGIITKIAEGIRTGQEAQEIQPASYQILTKYGISEEDYKYYDSMQERLKLQSFEELFQHMDKSGRTFKKLITEAFSKLWKEESASPKLIEAEFIEILKSIGVKDEELFSLTKEALEKKLADFMAAQKLKDKKPPMTEEELKAARDMAESIFGRLTNIKMGAISKIITDSKSKVIFEYLLDMESLVAGARLEAKDPRYAAVAKKLRKMMGDAMEVIKQAGEAAKTGGPDAAIALLNSNRALLAANNISIFRVRAKFSAGDRDQVSSAAAKSIGANISGTIGTAAVKGRSASTTYAKLPRTQTAHSFVSDMLGAKLGRGSDIFKPILAGQKVIHFFWKREQDRPTRFCVFSNSTDLGDSYVGTPSVNSAGAGKRGTENDQMRLIQIMLTRVTGIVIDPTGIADENTVRALETFIGTYRNKDKKDGYTPYFGAKRLETRDDIFIGKDNDSIMQSTDFNTNLGIVRKAYNISGFVGRGPDRKTILEVALMLCGKDSKTKRWPDKDIVMNAISFARSFLKTYDRPQLKEIFQNYKKASEMMLGKEKALLLEAGLIRAGATAEDVEKKLASMTAEQRELLGSKALELLDIDGKEYRKAILFVQEMTGLMSDKLEALPLHMSKKDARTAAATAVGIIEMITGGSLDTGTFVKINTLVERFFNSGEEDRPKTYSGIYLAYMGEHSRDPEITVLTFSPAESVDKYLCASIENYSIWVEAVSLMGVEAKTGSNYLVDAKLITALEKAAAENENIIRKRSTFEVLQYSLVWRKIIEIVPKNRSTNYPSVDPIGILLDYLQARGIMKSETLRRLRNVLVTKNKAEFEKYEQEFLDAVMNNRVDEAVLRQVIAKSPRAVGTYSIEILQRSKVLSYFDKDNYVYAKALPY